MDSQLKITNIHLNIDEFLERIKNKRYSKTFNDLLYLNENQKDEIYYKKYINIFTSVALWKKVLFKIWEFTYRSFHDPSYKQYVFFEFHKIFDYSEDELKELKKFIDIPFEKNFNIIWDSKLKDLITQFTKLSDPEIIGEYKWRLKEIEENKFGKNLKITKTKKDLNITGDSYILTFYCNDIQICTWKKGSGSYCSIDSRGVPSNIRNVRKPTKELNWNRENLIKITGNEKINPYGHSSVGPFKDGYPDFTWGYTGPDAPTNKSILNALEIAINNDTES